MLYLREISRASKAFQPYVTSGADAVLKHTTLERMADLPKIFRVHGHFGPGARGATT